MKNIQIWYTCNFFKVFKSVYYYIIINIVSTMLLLFSIGVKLG